MQYGSECWCGGDPTPSPAATLSASALSAGDIKAPAVSADSHAWGRYGKLSDGDCNHPCSGNKQLMCGSDLKNSVYKVTKRKPFAILHTPHFAATAAPAIALARHRCPFPPSASAPLLPLSLLLALVTDSGVNVAFACLLVALVCVQPLPIRW